MQTTNDGPTRTSQSADCSPATQPAWKKSARVNGKTINGRAVCGKSACTVRREGRRQIRRPYPYLAPPTRMRRTVAPARPGPRAERALVWNEPNALGSRASPRYWLRHACNWVVCPQISQIDAD